MKKRRFRARWTRFGRLINNFNHYTDDEIYLQTHISLHINFREHIHFAIYAKFIDK